jgi:TRAP-type C4-dicarboxylate transport system substrate-binding protein
MRKFIGMLTAVAALGLATAASAETTLRVSNWLPPSHPIVKDILAPWGEQVAKATDGRVKVEIMAAPIGKPPAQFDLIRSGAADVGYGVMDWKTLTAALRTIGVDLFVMEHDNPSDFERFASRSIETFQRF